MLQFYNLMSIIGLFFYLPFLLTKKGPEDRHTFIKERLGMSDYPRTDIWVHAVSVGETLACIPFLKKLKKKFPDKKIVLTTTTYTGQKIARDKFPEADSIMYMPLDSFPCVKNVVTSLRPEIFVTVETELWPALIQNLKRIGSRIVILNGRISNDSYKGYRKIKFFMKNILYLVDFFYMQDKGDAERIIALGADTRKVGVMGNFKFDIDFAESDTLPWMSNITGKILLAASTHRAEEEIILDAFDVIKNAIPGVKLILAPRHPERFNEVAEIIEKKSISFVRRSEIKELYAGSEQKPVQKDPEHQKTDNSLPDIVLLDTIGELSRVFSHVDVAFIGGSLVPVGGHNVMEPAYWSKPIIFGPHMDNFPIAEEFLKISAALPVRDARDIAETVFELLTDNEKAEKMGRNARSIVDNNTGAVKKALELIGSYLVTA